MMIARRHIFRSLRRAHHFRPCTCTSSNFFEKSNSGFSGLKTIYTRSQSFFENFQDNLRDSHGCRKNGANIQMRFLAQVSVKVPPLGESISEGSVKEILKGKGDYVREGEQVITIETDKLTSAVNSTSSGRITEVFVKEEDVVSVGGDLFSVDTDAKPPADHGATEKEVKKPNNEPEKKISKEKSDAPKQPTQQPAMPPPKPEPKSKPQKAEAPKISVFSREQNVVPMTRMRQRIAERLKGVQNETAFLTTFNEVDMSAIIAMRAKYGKLFMEKHQIKLGFMGSFMKACSVALMRIPQVNSTLSGKNLIFNNYADISVAVSTEKGLVTPIIRNCESLSIFELERELMEVSKKARENSLALEDISGGTFTISNGGVFGSLMGTPIINPPQSAILGMHATKKRPVEVDGKVEIRPMMYLALTYDHRVIDGKEAVNFLVNVKNIIEDPVRILLEI